METRATKVRSIGGRVKRRKGVASRKKEIAKHKKEIIKDNPGRPRVTPEVLALIDSPAASRFSSCWVNREKQQVEVLRGRTVVLKIALGTFSEQNTKAVTISLRRQGKTANNQIIGCDHPLHQAGWDQRILTIHDASEGTCVERLKMTGGHLGYRIEGNEESVHLRIQCNSSCRAGDGMAHQDLRKWQLVCWLEKPLDVTNIISIPLQVFSRAWSRRRAAEKKDSMKELLGQSSKAAPKPETNTGQGIPLDLQFGPQVPQYNLLQTGSQHSYNSIYQEQGLYPTDTQLTSHPGINSGKSTEPQNSSHHWASTNLQSTIASPLQVLPAGVTPAQGQKALFQQDSVSSLVSPHLNSEEVEENFHLQQYRLWYRSLKPAVREHQRDLVRKMLTV